MIVKATDIKNSFGKYIKLLDKEDIIVIRSGNPVAKITRHKDWSNAERIAEEAAAYGYGGIKMSYEEFMEMYENTDDRYEYIDGEAFLLASPRMTHQRVIGNLHVLFRSWFDGKKCMPYLSPFDVTLKKSKDNINVVQPDLLVICDPQNKNVNDTYKGVPALVVEILSITSSRMDLVKKLDLYMQTKVQEYWVVNYVKKEVTAYLFKGRDIADMKLFTKDETVKSYIFEGFELKMSDIFA